MLFCGSSVVVEYDSNTATPMVFLSSGCRLSSPQIVTSTLGIRSLVSTFINDGLLSVLWLMIPGDGPPGVSSLMLFYGSHVVIVDDLPT